MFSRLLSLTCRSIVFCNSTSFRLDRYSQFFKITTRNTCIMKFKSVLDICDFKFTPDDMRSSVDATIAKCRESYDRIANVPDDEVGFETVLKALDDVERELMNGCYSFRFIQYVAPDDEMRKASLEADKIFKDFQVEMNMRRDVFHKIEVLGSKGLKLTGEPKFYLEKLLESGKLYGLHLPPDVQAEVKSLNEKINEKCLQFGKNLSDVRTTVDFLESELDGMPEDFINSLPKSSDGRKRRVTLKYPHYFPIMRKCKNRCTRIAMNKEFDSQCLEENTALLEEVIQLRHKQAVLLGYSDHASLIISRCQAKTKEKVKKFLTDLYDKLRPAWLEEKKQILRLKEEEALTKAAENEEPIDPSDPKLYSYDMAYYTTKVKESRYNVDQNKLKEYFPLPVVTKGMFDIYQKLLGLVFTEIEDAKVWHPDVKLFSVKNSSDEELLGYFFLDLYPREGKYEHAAIEGIQNVCWGADGTRQIGIVVMMCNFSQPTDDKPALLQHDEVETYFHEFGHVMHSICSQNQYAHFQNHDIQSDFLEVPSMMLENWCWEEQPLKIMSKHYISGDPIPHQMILDLKRSRLADIGYSNIRQIVLSLFDLEIHSREKADTKEVYRKLSCDLLDVHPAEGTNFAAHFRHLCDMYDARYYGYLWSEVSSKDLFETRFKGHDLLDPEIGMRYRAQILEPAGSKNPSDILKDFLGRECTQDAFLRSLGLDV